MEHDGAFQGVFGMCSFCCENILTIPNLDATGHWWVGTLASFEFSPEHQKGVDNGAANALS